MGVGRGEIVSECGERWDCEWVSMDNYFFLGHLVFWLKTNLYKFFFQAQYHVARAKTIDEQERAARKKQTEEREKFRREQEALLRSKEEERRAQLEEKVRAREVYKEKMRNATQIEVIYIILHFIKFQN